MASQIEKDSTGSVRGGNLRPEIITIILGQNYRDMNSEAQIRGLRAAEQATKLTLFSSADGKKKGKA